MIKDAVKVWGAGAVLYVVIAACSASNDSSGGWVKNGGGGSSSFFDALSDPVPEAQAGEPQVNDETCTLTFQYSGMTQYYAEHLYPGKTRAQLALVRTLVNFPTNGSVLPGYASTASAQTYVDDGKVAVWCGSDAKASSYTVTFVLP
jgi:hypothetical protein